MSPKMVQCLCPILQKLGFQVSNASNPIYEDSQPTIDIIKAKHLTSQVKNIALLIYYVYEQYSILAIYPIKMKTNMHPVDIGNNISTGPLLDIQYYYI